MLSHSPAIPVFRWFLNYQCQCFPNNVFILYISMETVLNEGIYTLTWVKILIFSYPSPLSLNKLRKWLYPRHCLGPFSHSSFDNLTALWISVLHSCPWSFTVTFSRKNKILWYSDSIHLPKFSSGSLPFSFTQQRKW